MSTIHDTIIVGAGICGLTAAFELVTKSKTPGVLVLEEDVRAGGRAQSITLDNGTIINTGANWFHGGDDNDFYQWVKLRYETGPMVLDERVNKKVLWDKQDPEMTFTYAYGNFEQAYERFKKQNPDKDASMADIARLTGDKDIDKVAQFMARGWMASDDASIVSARDFFEDPLGSGGWQMANGINPIIDQMVSDVESRGADFVYNTMVKEVRDENDQCEIITADGTSYHARKVLLTCSVGVLQSGLIALPEKASSVLEAEIKGLRMAELFKAVLPLKETFFEDKQIASDWAVYVLENDHPCFIHARTSGKPTITFFAGGAQARRMEEWSSERIESYVHKVLNKVREFEGFEQYVDGPLFTTSWAKKLSIQGSYAVNMPHQQRTDPIRCGNLYFAGEALLKNIEDSPGQMAGAFHAGRKVASMMMGPS